MKNSLPLLPFETFTMDNSPAFKCSFTKFSSAKLYKYSVPSVAVAKAAVFRKNRTTVGRKLAKFLKKFK
jgi:hypothetical protein